MKLSYQAVLLSALAVAMGACSEDNPWMSEGEGGIALRLSASADVKDAIPVLRSEVPSLEAPSPSDFSISLTNLTTEEVKTWATLADFQNQRTFATGQYTLTAFYGDVDDEGFEKPCFKGEAQVNVLESRESTVEVTATLANSMVSIDYTDGFRSYFRDYGVTVHSEGHSYIEFAGDETRPAFVAPGEVSLIVSVTNPSGKTATIQPAAFPAAPQCHYHVTFDVNTGDRGDAQLQIIFDDSLTQEDVFIDLTDELFSSPAPKVTPTGFTDGQTIELLSGNSAEQDLKFNVVAYGGISSALLTISGDGFTPAFGSEVELVNASAAVQQQLAELGITAVGLFKNPSNLATVDVSGLAAHLPVGKFAVSLVVKDPFTRVSEPLTLNISTEPVVLEVEDGTAIFNSGQATINVSYNGADPEKNISFKALAKTGVYKECEVLSVTESSRTRSFDVKDYIFTIALPDTDRDRIPVRVFFGGAEKTEVNVDVVIPQYDIEIDPFATYAKLKVVPANASDLAAIVNCLSVYANGNAVAADHIYRNAETGIVAFGGLTPATNYAIGTSLTSAAPASTQSITTEAATAVPNGDFSDTYEAINMQGINVGGQYTGTIFGTPKYQKTGNIVRNMATGWASLNDLTCYSGASNINTWFCVPSTYVENGEVTVRSVGYSHNGTTPSTTQKTGIWYCQNSPSFSDSEKCAGELFLGSYSFDGSAHRVDGIDFASRPQQLSFDYKYVPYNNETGKVEVSVIGVDGSVLASQTDELASTASMTTKTVSLSGYPFGSKAASLRVRFVSSTSSVPAINVISGASLQVGNSLASQNVGTNDECKAFAAGSVLTVDNVKLIY